VYKRQQQIGKLIVPWKTELFQESNIGNFLTDVMRKYAKADFSILNSGSIRKSVDSGSIKKQDILEMLPFNNVLVGFTCTGKDLLKILENNGYRLLKHDYEVLQVSGLKFEVTKGRNGKSQILNARVNDEPLQEDKVYRGISVDYVVYDHAMKFFGFAPQQTEKLEFRLTEMVIDYIINNPNIDSKIEGRMILKKSLK